MPLGMGIGIGMAIGSGSTGLPGLASQYRADLGTLDSTGTQQSSGPIQTWKDQYGSYNAVQTVTAAMATAGLVGGKPALSFDGTDDAIPVATVPASAGAFSIEAWIYQSQQTAAVYYPIYAQPGLGLHIKGANLAFHGAADYTSAGSVALNTWTYVAVTYDGATVRLYLNGVQDANTYAVTGLNLPGPGTIGTGTVGIGGISSAALFFNGGIADLVTRTTMLSAAQVLREYQSWGPH